MSEEPIRGPVAVVGDDGGAVAELIESVGIPTGDVSAASAIVAVGWDSLLGLAADPPPTPVLPVAVSGPIDTVPADELQAALEHLSGSTYALREHPTLAVRIDDQRTGTILTDMMLVTAEPAHISEYSLRTPMESLATVRADGVVIATPAGSRGYARRVGGPIVAPDVPALSVVPVGAFRTERDHWIVSLPDSGTAIQLTVERDDAPVSLLLENRDAGVLEPGVELTLERDGTLTLLSVPESVSHTRRPATRTSRSRPQELGNSPLEEESHSDVDRLFPRE